MLRLIVAAVAAVALSACGSVPGAAGGADAPPELLHVHGLGESAEGLYVATHHGLFEVVDGELRNVGQASHDLMGFTVAGPDDLLASGHPDMRVDDLQVAGKPPLLGLVHSTDGETWRSLSLLGEADFHSLEAAHGQVYGFDGTRGRFMVSEDRQRWETRAEGIGLVDFAVSPDDADLVVATVEGGTVRSEDGGRTWEPVSDTQLVFLDWAPSGLFGVTPGGEVLVSGDAGASWEPRGTLGGQPEALLATDEAVYGAASGRGILASTDGGETFEVLAATGG